MITQDTLAAEHGLKPVPRATEYMKHGKRHAPKPKRPTPTRDAVFAVLGKTPMSCTEIADKIGRRADAVSSALCYAYRDGLVNRKRYKHPVNGRMFFQYWAKSNA